MRNNPKAVMVLAILAVVVLSGCLGGDGISAKGNGLEITSFSADQATVFEGRTVRITMEVENQGESVVDDNNFIAFLTIPTDWKVPNTGADLVREQEITRDINPEDRVREIPAGTEIFTWRAKAPDLPRGQTRTDVVLGRIYYDYETDVRGTVWVYPETEYLASDRASVQKSNFVTTKGPVRIDVSVAPDPAVVAEAGEGFVLSIVATNIGGGTVYQADFIEKGGSVEIGEAQINRLDIEIDYPTDDLVLVDQGCTDDIELINNKATIICDIQLQGTTLPPTRTAYPITVSADYGYYTDSEISITVSGRT